MEKLIEAVTKDMLLSACEEALAYLYDPRGWETEHNARGVYLPALLREAIDYARLHPATPART